MSRSIALLAVLALVAAPAGAQEPPQTGRIWKGTLGDQAITACFFEGDGSEGVFYTVAALEPIRLEVDGDGGPADLREMRGYDDPTGAVWSLSIRAGGWIEGEWRKTGQTQRIRLAAEAVTLPEYGTACETAAFLDPLLKGGTVTSQRETFEGTGYTVLEYTGSQRAGLADYSITVFALDPVRPGDGAINAALAKSLPDGTADSDMGQCYGSGLRSGLFTNQGAALAPLMITLRWLGLRYSGSDFCGGPHPNHYVLMKTYDRDSGAEVDPSTWFKPGALAFYDWENELDPKPAQRPVAGLSDALAKALRAHWPKREDEDECGLLEEFDGTSWDIGLTRKGLVFVPQLPHVIFACTEGVVIPWSKVRPFLSDEGRAVMASLR